MMLISMSMDFDSESWMFVSFCYGKMVLISGIVNVFILKIMVNLILKVMFCWEDGVRVVMRLFLVGCILME